jgi:hypothetical protein
MNTTNNLFPSIFIPQKHKETALKFASEQATKSKGKRVYFNTLAIYMVRDFLEWMQIETDLNKSESWHPGIRSLLDIADLVIPDLGIIECRPVLPGETVISLPPEVTEDRIAYVAVQFQEQLNEVQLLGFYPAVDPQPEVIEIASLKPIELLIDFIDRLESAQLEPVTNIGAWRLPEIAALNLDVIYDNTWQKLDDFINSLAGNQLPRFAMGLRSSSPNPELPSESVRKAKEIDLGQNRMVLVINCQQKDDDKTYIFIRLYPFLAEEIYLPSGVAIIILDESGNVFSEVQAGRRTKMLEMKEFRGDTGERFTIKVALGNMNYTENFVI